MKNVNRTIVNSILTLFFT